MNRILFLCLSLMLFLPLAAQNSKKVKELKQQQSKLKTELQNSKTQLSKTQKRVKSGQQNVDYLGALVNNRLKRIHELEEQGSRKARRIRRITEKERQFSSRIRLSTLLFGIFAAAAAYPRGEGMICDTLRWAEMRACRAQ